MLFKEIKNIIPFLEYEKDNIGQLTYFTSKYGEMENGMATISLVPYSKVFQLEHKEASTDWMKQEVKKNLSDVGVNEDLFNSVLLKNLEIETTKDVLNRIQAIGHEEYKDRIGRLQDFFIGRQKGKLTKKYYKFVFWFYRFFLKKEKDIVFKLDPLQDNSRFFIIISKMFENINGHGGVNFIITSKENVCEFFENSINFSYNNNFEINTNHVIQEEGILASGIKIYSSPYLDRDSVVFGKLGDIRTNSKLFLCYNKGSIIMSVIENPVDRKIMNKVGLNMGVFECENVPSNFLKLKIRSKK